MADYRVSCRTRPALIVAIALTEPKHQNGARVQTVTKRFATPVVMMILKDRAGT
jgi:hypothetical protein